jgi:CheY-like chemotaxis protein
VNNAIKYSGDGKWVRLEVRSVDSGWPSRCPTGHRHPEERAEEDLREVLPGEDSLVHETKGSGLGLPLVQHIMEAHGGEVQVESTPGKGSTFTLVLPVTQPKRKREKILIVEDEPDMVLGLKDNFEFEGYEVLTAADGQSGLERARQGKPDLVILDIMLPKLSGLEVCKTLRGEGFEAPIIMLTARGQEIDKVVGSSWGRTTTSRSRSPSASCWPGCARSCGAPTAARSGSPNTVLRRGARLRDLPREEGRRTPRLVAARVRAAQIPDRAQG